MRTFSETEVATMIEATAKEVIRQMMAQAQTPAATTNPAPKAKRTIKADAVAAVRKPAKSEFATLIGTIGITVLKGGGVRIEKGQHELRVGASRVTAPLTGEGQTVFKSSIGAEVSERAIARLRDGKTAKVRGTDGWLELSPITVQ